MPSSSPFWFKRPLSQVDTWRFEFESVTGSDQIEAETEPDAPRALALTQDTKDLHSANRLLDYNVFAGQRSIVILCVVISKLGLDFLTGVWLFGCGRINL